MRKFALKPSSSETLFLDPGYCLRSAFLVGLVLAFLNLLAPYLPAQSRTPSRDFDALAKQAAEARDSNRLDEAVSLYQKALALRPGWAEGWWSLGTLEYDRNNYNNSARAFRRLLPLAPKDGTALVMLGLCEFELGLDENALKHVEEGKKLGIAKGPQLQDVVIYHEGVLLQRQGKFEAAQEALGQLCLKGQQEAKVTETLGLVALRIRGKHSLAEGSPDSEIIQWTGHAACLMAQKKFDESRQEYSAITKKYPMYPNIHYAFGRLLVELNETRAAVEEFKEEIKNHPNDVVSRLQIAAATYKIDSVAGLPYAEEAVKLDPQSPFAHYLFGLLLLDTDDYLQAIPQLEIAKRAFPRDAKVYFALGSAYSRAGRQQDAARARAAFMRLSRETGQESNPNE